jgi:hypothetical protein
VDAELRIDDSEIVRTNFARTDPMPEACRAETSEFPYLLIRGLWARHDFDLAYAVKGALIAKVVRGSYSAHNGREILIRAEILAIDYGSILKVAARQADSVPLLVRCTGAGAMVNASAGGALKRADASGITPGLWSGHIFLSEAYIGQGRTQDALREIEQLRFGYVRAFLYTIAYHALGRTKESDTEMGELINKYQASSPYMIAEVYASQSQSDEAFQWLDRACETHDGGLIATKVDPLLKNLHHDPRYDVLLKKLNLLN